MQLHSPHSPDASLAPSTPHVLRYAPVSERLASPLAEPASEVSASFTEIVSETLTPPNPTQDDSLQDDSLQGSPALGFDSGSEISTPALPAPMPLLDDGCADEEPPSFSPDEINEHIAALKEEAISEGLEPDNVLNLPYNLKIRAYQEKVWNYMMQDKVGLRALTVWARRNGKDLIALNVLIAKAIQKPGLYLYIGPLHTQTRQIVWLGSTNEGRKFLDFIPPQIIKGRPRNSQMEVDLINGSMIKVVGSDQFDSLMGLNALGAVFTEYSLQRPEAWDYIRPMMAANGGWALFNGTPRGMNHMFTMYEMARKNPDWFCELLTADDTGVPTKEAIAEERSAGMKESLIEQEFYCSWTASSESVFIPLDVVAPTITPAAELQPKFYHHEPRVFGVDVAYSIKGDKAVIACRQGRKLHWMRWYRGKDNMAFASEIAKFIKIVRPHAIFIDAGRGEGVISRLEQLGYGHLVHGIHFGGKVYEEGILNKKAHMWCAMEDWFADYNKPDMTNLDTAEYANEEVESQLITELSTPLKLIDEKQQISVESKKALASRGYSSPDLADALALTFAEEVETDEMVAHELEQMGVSTELLSMYQQQQNEAAYDPLNYMDTLVETA